MFGRPLVFLTSAAAISLAKPREREGAHFSTGSYCFYMHEDTILKKLEGIDEKMRSLAAQKSLDKIDENIGRVALKVVAIDEKMKGLATQESMNTKFEGVTQVLDDQTVILKRLDQERLFMLERVKRIEADVEKLKLQLHLV